MSAIFICVPFMEVEKIVTIVASLRALCGASRCMLYYFNSILNYDDFHSHAFENMNCICFICYNSRVLLCFKLLFTILVFYQSRIFAYHILYIHTYIQMNFTSFKRPCQPANALRTLYMY